MRRLLTAILIALAIPLTVEAIRAAARLLADDDYPVIVRRDEWQRDGRP